MNAPVMNLMDDQNRLEASDKIIQWSIHNFLSNFPKSVSNLSSLISLYREFIEKLTDPPLGIVWFYGAIVFQSYKPSSLLPPEKLLVAEDLLELVNECSCSCSVLTKVAVLAPVVYHLYHLDYNYAASDPSLREEIGIAVEGIVNHISICFSQYLDEGGQRSENLGACILDLIRISMVDPVRDSEANNILASFFPSLGNEFQPEVIVSSGYLAGVVMNETLLIRLRLKISPGIDKEDLMRNMLNCAIQTIKGFQNFYFLDMLLRMLSGPSLPIAAKMSYEDAVVLHKALYDAVILVDYSYYSGRWVESSYGQLKRLAVAWVLAADYALQFARAATDQSRASSYLQAFNGCQLVAELIKWVCDQAGISDRNAIPDITNPRALITWLLVLNNQGIQVFDHSMSTLYAKAVACISKLETEPPELSLRPPNFNENVIDLTESDKSEDGDIRYQSNNGLYLTSAKKGAGRKRKEALSGIQEPQVKQIKLDHLGRTVGSKFLSLSSGCAPDNGGLVKLDAPDDDMDLVG